MLSEATDAIFGADTERAQTLSDAIRFGVELGVGPGLSWRYERDTIGKRARLTTERIDERLVLHDDLHPAPFGLSAMTMKTIVSHELGGAK
ncbi:MAG TPA: hypothetical protein VI565_05945 [Burkholderiales bacterium]|nr:hypothetical protein [Burkholderiales bacterium]